MEKPIDSAIVFVYNKDQTKVLMLNRVKKVGFDWGYVSGKVKEGKTPKDCATKEIIEELRLKDFNLTQLKKIKHTKYGEIYFHHYFKIQIDEKTKINFEPKEIQTVEWFDLHKLPASRALDNPKEI